MTQSDGDIVTAYWKPGFGVEGVACRGYLVRNENGLIEMVDERRMRHHQLSTKFVSIVSDKEIEANPFVTAQQQEGDGMNINDNPFANANPFALANNLFAQATS